MSIPRAEPHAEVQATTRGHRKRSRTRRRLLDAGLRVLAAKGEAMTVIDVVHEAEVSNGTFYNYFRDVEDLQLVLAAEIAAGVAETAALDPLTDPAERFANATAKVLAMAEANPAWGRAFVRLAARPDGRGDLMRHARDDLNEGARVGRFATAATDATVDQLSGLVVMTIARIVDGRGRAATVAEAVARGLEALGVAPAEAMSLAQEATSAARTWVRDQG